MIGVYDSGFGGLGVLRHLRRELPSRDFCYLGDSGRAPYGGRDPYTLLDFGEQCVERLFAEGCQLVVVACNTMACVALRHLQRRYAGPDSVRRVLGVAIPGAEAAVRASRAHIGVIATARTVASGTYAAEICKLATRRVTQYATPLLAPIVEEGWEDTYVARLAVRRYLDALLEDRSIDTLLLGCTHYPMLLGAIEAAARGVCVVDPGAYVAERLADWLVRHPGFDEEGSGALRVLCTGDPESFARHGERFLGEPVPRIARLALESGRLARRDTDAVPRGQLVR